MEEREQKRFVSSNRWPSERLVDHYVRTYQLHGELRLEDGPKYYNHSLAKELYNAAGKLTRYVNTLAKLKCSLLCSQESLIE